MLLSLRMLRRDLRAGELGLLLVALIIAVTSLTSVGFFTDRVARALKLEANQLLGGDVVLVADHALKPEWRAEATRRGLRAVESASFTSMATLGEGAQLAGVKVVEDGHPLRIRFFVGERGHRCAPWCHCCLARTEVPGGN